MEKLYVIIPAYNEGMNIEQCIDDWYPIVERHNGNGESRLVIINEWKQRQHLRDHAETGER